MSGRVRLSTEYIRGMGIELCGRHYTLPVGPNVEVTHVDLDRDELATLPVPSHLKVVDHPEELANFKDDALDFVIANHVFEHCENPIHTLYNWLRVLKPGGLIFAAIPNKDHTFDKPRPITPFAHLLIDATFGPHVCRRAHYEDWYRNSKLEGNPGADVDAQVTAAMERKQNIHWHVWDYPAMCQMFERLSTDEDFRPILPFEIVHHEENGIEVLWILRKCASPA